MGAGARAAAKGTPGVGSRHTGAGEAAAGRHGPIGLRGGGQGRGTLSEQLGEKAASDLAKSQTNIAGSQAQPEVSKVSRH